MKIVAWCCIAFLVLGISCNLANESGSKTQAPFVWKSVSTEKEPLPGIDSLMSEINKGTYGNIDELFIAKGNQILVNESFKLNYQKISKGQSGKMGCGYQSCKDTTEINEYNYYHPKYHPYYEASSMHTLQSITKSVVSSFMLYAISEGVISSVDDIILPYFTDQLDEKDPLYKHFGETTIEDLLTMRSGLDWKEMGLSLEEDSDVSLMERSPDWLAYILDRPVKESAGELWNYNSGDTQLLAYILQKAVGQDLGEYAKSGLFRKLGIDAYHWKKTPKLRQDAEGGMYLSSQDLAKIGRLYLQKGSWQGDVIIQSSLIEAATYKHVTDLYQDGGEEGYGYQWWLTGSEDKPYYIGLGYGNQILLLSPTDDVVAIVLAWNVFEGQNQKYILGDLFSLMEQL